LALAGHRATRGRRTRGGEPLICISRPFFACAGYVSIKLFRTTVRSRGEMKRQRDVDVERRAEGYDAAVSLVDKIQRGASREDTIDAATHVLRVLKDAEARILQLTCVVAASAPPRRLLAPPDYRTRCPRLAWDSSRRRALRFYTKLLLPLLLSKAVAPGYPAALASRYRM